MANTDNFIISEIQKAKAGFIGVITLNRPQALHALNHAMIIELTHCLLEWQDNAQIKAVLIRANESNAFCAGGDVREVYREGKVDPIQARQFFWDEYRLNHLIHHYPKPYIALLDGITMGGGVGISLHSPYAIATENFTFAMPETAIGFFPDIGSSYLLNRCPGKMGVYIALTGVRLNAHDCIELGLLSYHVTQADLDNIVNHIYALESLTHAHLSKLLSQWQKQKAPSQLLAQHDKITHGFNADTIEMILDHLSQDHSPWAQQTYEKLMAVSPTSLKVTLALLQQTKNTPFAECLRLDYRIVCRMLLAHDFYAGVCARLIEKKPVATWQPANLVDINQQHIASYFEPLTEQELVFLHNEPSR